MAPFALTTDKNTPRCFPWLWSVNPRALESRNGESYLRVVYRFVRVAQMVITIIILAITASNASDFSTIGCSVPSKLGYNIAAVSLNAAQPMMEMLIFHQGGFVIPCAHCTSPLDWAEARTKDPSMVHLGYTIDKREQSPAPKGLTRSLHERAYGSYHRPGAGKAAGKTALDSIITVLFAFTTATSILWIFQNRRSGAGATAPTMAGGPTAPHQPAPVAIPSTQVYPDKTEEGYTGPPPQHGTYPLQSQPQMQQGGHPGPVTNMQAPTYPNSAAPGSATEYYRPNPATQPQQPQYPPNHAEMGSHPTEYKSVSPVSAQ
ncbi:MAG: hypothetical protein Q9219_004030 [cf. Caloplaca sp. 3 TL-2023]